jgi:hypothetical protein
MGKMSGGVGDLISIRRRVSREAEMRCPISSLESGSEASTSIVSDRS